MKKVIKGTTYNTETATKIHDITSGCNVSYNDFRYINTSLYMTKSGKYFFVGEGGAATIHAAKCGDNTRSFGRGIVIYDELETQWILEQYGLSL